MAGSIVNPKRPRFQANERFDTEDADAQSRAPREQLKAYTRAVASTPRSTAGSPSTIGLIISGFELTLNPTSGSDGKVRIGSNAGVALDADGGLVIKPSGTTLDVTIPVGTYQLYVYFTESATDSAKRRFLSVTQPYTESTNTMNTSFIGDWAVFVRAGNAGTTVPEDAVLGVTVPLCCIGVVTNTAGAITCTGYNAISAPNGTDVVNRMSSVIAAPSSLPLTPYVNGSMKSLTDAIQALAYMVGQLGWKGSSSVPALANNFQAWNAPVTSIAKINEYLTAGNFVGPSTFNDTLKVYNDLTVGGQPLTITPFTFTTDFTTNICTAVAHGRRTGDGPFQLTTTNTLPSPLAPATNYWFVRLNANTFKWATSLNAAYQVASGQPVEVDLLNNGTGVHTVNSTGSTLAVADIIGSRDAVLAGSLFTGFHASIGGNLTVTGQTTLLQTLTMQSNTDIVLSGTGKVRHGMRQLVIPFNASNDVLAPFKTIDATHAFVLRGLDIPVGLTIDQVFVTVKDNATGAQSLAAQFESWTVGLVNADIHAFNNSNGSGTVQTLNTASGLGIVVTNTKVFDVAVFYNGGAGTQNCTAGIILVNVFQA